VSTSSWMLAPASPRQCLGDRSFDPGGVRTGTCDLPRSSAGVIYWIWVTQHDLSRNILINKVWKYLLLRGDRGLCSWKKQSHPAMGVTVLWMAFGEGGQGVGNEATTEEMSIDDNDHR